VAADDSLTFHPSPIRVANRALWESTRLALPVLPAFLVAFWATQLPRLAQRWSGRPLHLAVLPLAALATAAFLLLVTIATKWTLLGRMREGRHVLWSCWCSRWDFMYMVWARVGQPVLARFEGTLVLAWYLRAMGMRIGKRVVLGPGFSQVVDPDMIRIDDDATVHALFQAHTFEDRMLKIDRVRIRKRATVGCGTVLFYGVDVGEGAAVAAQSVIMKHERLAPGRRYEGCPSASAPIES
jgi:non-ribosomal peptide synthetase-like protein